MLTDILNGGILAHSQFYKYILVLGAGTILGGIIYFMDYKKIIKYSPLIYMIGIILNAYCSFISQDTDAEILYAILPFYAISFVGFISQINHKKSNAIKATILATISLLFLRKNSGGTGISVSGFMGMTYLIIITAKILSNSKRNKIRYIVILWAIPILILGNHAYEMRKVRLETSSHQSGWEIAKNELITSAEVFGTVNDPRRNSNDTTSADYINSYYEFYSFLGQYGWIVSIGMTLACLLLSIKLIINVVNIKDTYGKLLVTAIASIYILQAVSNFRMSFSRVGVLTDAPIPLITFGTIGIFVNILSMALVLSVYRDKNMRYENEAGGVWIEN